MAVLEDTAAVVGRPLLEVWNTFVDSFPNLVAAILILILGYLIGALFGHILTKVLEKTKVLMTIIKRIDLHKEIGHWDLPHFFGLITKWYIFVIFLNPAAQVVRFHTLSSFFSRIALWIPNIILALVIFLAGYVLSEYISKKIQVTKAKKNSMLANTAKVITLVYVVLIALKQVGIEVAVAENSFLIILAGIMLGAAIAFGLGLKDEAKSFLKQVKKRI